MSKRQLFIQFSATQKFAEIDRELKMTVRRAVLKTLENQKFPYAADVSVTFCDNAYIRKLNKEYRGVDKHTDVLSFPIYDNGEFDEAECEQVAMLGDIVISVERTKEQAEELGNTFQRETAFLAVHSTLHLLGYDHERSAEDDELQCRLQKEIINSMEF